MVGYRPAEQINECELVCEIVEAGGSTRRMTDSFALRYLFRYELEHLLVRAGFELVDLVRRLRPLDVRRRVAGDDRCRPGPSTSERARVGAGADGGRTLPWPRVTRWALTSARR